MRMCNSFILRWLDVSEYVCSDGQSARQLALSKPGGKLFSGMKAAVMLNEKAKRFEDILQNGGATLVHIDRNKLKRPETLRDLQFVFSEPEFLKDQDFLQFKRQSEQCSWNIKFYSYFYILNYVMHTNRTSSDYFALDNSALTELLHAKTTNAAAKIRRREAVTVRRRDQLLPGD